MIINQEFKNLIPPLTEDEYNQLEQNCIAEGIRDSLVTWQGTLIDGHNRYEIATKHNLTYTTIDKKFDSEHNVIEWIIYNQLGRRNLSNYQRSVLALRLEPIFQKKAKENKIQAMNKSNKAQGKATFPLISAKTSKPIDTREELAKIAGVGHDTIAKVQKIEKEATPEVKQKLLIGEISINEAYKDIKEKNKYSKVAERIKTQLTQAEVNIQITKKLNIQYGDVYKVKKQQEHLFIIYSSFEVEKIKKYAVNINCVLTDPPYGINYKSPSGSGYTSRGDYKIINNDNQQFDPYILFEYSKNIITWGANHYANKLENSAGWLVWDKREGEQINNNSDCELAYTTMINSARMFHHKWNGMIKASEQNEKRIHPTQKPVKLFEWCLEVTRAGNNIIDLYAGSGTTLLACENTKRNSILVENDLDFAGATLNRFMSMGYEVEKHDKIV